MRLGLWIRATRAPFFQAVLVPLFLGTAAAWYRSSQFSAGYFLLALVAVVCILAGTNLANDYFDHKSGADALNRQYTRFSGGSRVIQDGLIPPDTVFRASLIFLGLGGLIGLYLAWNAGWAILVIGMIGIASGYFYSAAPVKADCRGWGELLVGLNCGPLVVLGAYYIQAHALALEALVASVPVGLLVAAILYINQFPDYEADKAVSKAHLVVRMGPERAVKGFYLLLTSTYLVIVLACAFKVIPRMCLISLLSVPLAWRAAKVARGAHATGSGKELLPAMASTIAAHLATGLLMTCGYAVAKVLR